MKNPSGQTTLQLIGPLIIILILAFGLAFFMPKMSTLQTVAVAGGIVLFILSFASS